MLDLGSLMTDEENKDPDLYIRNHMTVLIESNGMPIDDNRVDNLLESLG
jgi:hypothetical protein